MKKLLFTLTFFPHTLLYSSDVGTLFMSATLFTLLLTLIVTLAFYIKKLQREGLKNHLLFDLTNTATLYVTHQGEILDANQTAQTLLGYSKQDLLRQRWYDKLLPDERAIQIRHQIYRTLSKDGRVHFDTHLINADAKLLEIHCTLSKLPPPFRGTILTLVDITQNETLCKELTTVQRQLDQTRHDLQHLSEQFKVTFDIAINGIALLDEKGRIIYLNRALCEMFEYNEDYLKHLGITLLLNDNESVQPLLETVKGGEKIDKMHIQSLTRSGRRLDIDLSMGYLPEIKQYYLVVQDITKTLAYTTELQRSKKHLEQRVVKDHLTSAYNRVYMEETLERMMLLKNEPFGLIILDIDHFKHINDTYSHLVGDDVLIDLVSILNDQLRKEDILARFGGEEFVIILPQTSHTESLLIAQKLQTYIAAYKFEGCPKITCSFGVESFNGTQDRRALLLSADRALYRAKEEGRNRVIDARTLPECDYII